MELWRRAANPWGEEVLIGVSWDLMWFAIAASALFMVGHTLLVGSILTWTEVAGLTAGI